MIQEGSHERSDSMALTRRPAPTPTQVLIIEDESEIRELMSLLALRQGFGVKVCESAAEGLEEVRLHTFDLIILDWMLPNMSGLEFLKHPEIQGIPVLMVTAKAEPKDIIAGLEAGAADYVTKPFEPAVLMARMRALVRRAPVARKADGQILEAGQLRLNLETYEFKLGGVLVKLTPSEFKILAELLQNKGRVLTRDQLIGIVQGEGISVTGRTIDTHVFGLRKKLEGEADWIETIRGVGYRLKAD